MILPRDLEEIVLSYFWSYQMHKTKMSLLREFVYMNVLAKRSAISMTWC
jgi:hypothetical protein